MKVNASFRLKVKDLKDIVLDLEKFDAQIIKFFKSEDLKERYIVCEFTSKKSLVDFVMSHGEKYVLVDEL